MPRRVIVVGVALVVSALLAVPSAAEVRQPGELSIHVEAVAGEPSVSPGMTIVPFRGTTAMIGIITAIALPTLLEARISSNESATMTEPLRLTAAFGSLLEVGCVSSPSSAPDALVGRCTATGDAAGEGTFTGTVEARAGGSVTVDIVLRAVCLRCDDR